MNPDLERLARAGLDVPRIAVGIVKMLILPTLLVLFLAWLQYHFFSHSSIGHDHSRPGESCQAEVRGVIREPFTIFQVNEEHRYCDKLIESGRSNLVEPWYLEQYKHRQSSGPVETKEQAAARKKAYDEKMMAASQAMDKENSDLPDCSVHNEGYDERYCSGVALQLSERKVADVFAAKNLTPKLATYKDKREAYCEKKLAAEGYEAGIGSAWAVADANCAIGINEQVIRKLSK